MQKEFIIYYLYIYLLLIIYLKKSQKSVIKTCHKNEWKKHWNLTILYLIRKKPVELLSLVLDQVVVSYKFKHNSKGFKYFIGYLEGEIAKLLCLILP